jgi:hypothetical protein
MSTAWNARRKANIMEMYARDKAARDLKRMMRVRSVLGIKNG